jgi:hypothetical protein
MMLDDGVLAPKINQFGIRRSGLHAVMGWLQSLGLVIEPLYDDGRLPIPGPYRKTRYRCFENVEAPLIQRHIERHPEQVSFVQLRDPYNWLASRLHLTTTEEYVGYSVALYKEYAHQTLLQKWGGETWWLNYNLWVTEPEYRVAIAERFCLETDGSPYLEVASNGGGSSFDGLAFRGRASMMPVLHRWQYCVHDVRYRSFIDDEMVNIGEQLFGMGRPW